MRWLISAVARVFQPGCKADHCLILEGAQGAGKSTAAATIALDDAWFSDELADLGTKDAAQDLRGKWIVELGELSALNRGAVERVKAFMSRRVDHYRPSLRQPLAGLPAAMRLHRVDQRRRLSR